MEYVIGMDFGGTSVKAGIVDDEGRIIERDTIPIDALSSFDEIMTPVIQWIKNRVKKNELEIRAVGIGTPGFTDKKRGILIAGAENIPSLKGHSIPGMIEKQTGVVAFADNDATCAAAGELLFGIGKKYRNFVMITLGTGIGGGIAIDGRIYRGRDGFAGEIGHMCLDPGGPHCNCGSRGCFEQYASGPAMVRLYSEKLKKRGIKPSEKLTPKDLFDAARRNDEVAMETLDLVGLRIAQAFGTLLNIFNAGACIMGGGISKSGDLLKKIVSKHLPDFVWPELLENVSLEIAELQNDAGIIGAAAQAYERLLSK